MRRLNVQYVEESAVSVTVREPRAGEMRSALPSAGAESSASSAS